jgi:hypothetical protein
MSVADASSIDQTAPWAAFDTLTLKTAFTFESVLVKSLHTPLCMVRSAMVVLAFTVLRLRYNDGKLKANHTPMLSNI